MCPCTLDNCKRTERPGNCPWKPLPQLPDPTAEKPGCLDTSFQTQFRGVRRPQKTEKTDFISACDQEPASEDSPPLLCFPPGPLPDLPQGWLNRPHHGPGETTLQTRTFKISKGEERTKVTSWFGLGLRVQIQVADSKLWAPPPLLAEDC